MKKHELRTLIRSQLKELTSNNNVDCKYLDKNIREVKELYKFFVKIRNTIDSLTNS